MTGSRSTAGTANRLRLTNKKLPDVPTVNSVVNLTLTKPRLYQARAKRLKKLWLGMAALALFGTLLTGLLAWPVSPPDLGSGNRLLTSGLLASWRDGNLVVLVRHEERCDRSSNPCFGPADGLTINGTQQAVDIGKAFKTLGMENSDVLSSPTTRTAQTSLFMFGKSELLPSQLAICGDAMGEEILSQKAPGHNLVLLTHSACISDIERALGYPHAKATEYGSALFVEVLGSGKLKAVGIINSGDWPAALKQL
jgi:phosphohistidine phosphatase SixA